MIYISQIIILYILNLHSTVCQLYLNKIGRKIQIPFSTKYYKAYRETGKYSLFKKKNLTEIITKEVQTLALLDKDLKQLF